MKKIFLVSDHHLGKESILTWRKLSEPFKNMDEYHTYIIKAHNQVVEDGDKVYFLGDFAMTKESLKLLKEFKGKKTLVAGNHDIFDTKEYLDAGFKNVRGIKILSSKIVLTHVPINPNCFDRFTANYHGHLHHSTLADKRYQNMCLEHLPNWQPQVLQKFYNFGT